VNTNHCQWSKAEESDEGWDEEHDDVSEDHDDVSEDHDDVSEDHDDVSDDHDDTSSKLNKETGILEMLITLSNLMWIL
jgi:hypothetical protein